MTCLAKTVPLALASVMVRVRLPEASTVVESTVCRQSKHGSADGDFQSTRAVAAAELQMGRKNVAQRVFQPFCSILRHGTLSAAHIWHIR